MNAPLIRVAVVLATLAGSLRAAEEEPKSSMKEALKARIAEDARKAEPKPAAPAASKPATTPAATDTPLAKSESKPDPKAGAKADAATAKAAAGTPAEKPTVLPKVEVKKGRITVLDQKLALQDQEIARERKNMKSTEVDLALNDSKIAKPLSIFGGESAQFRKRVASERVELMEAEKDVMEAIAHAKTREEKQELQKQLDELRTMRRELDKSLR